MCLVAVISPSLVHHKMRTVLELEYKELLSELETKRVEKELSPLLASLRMDVIASSRTGLTVSATKAVVEQTFKTRVEVRPGKVDRATPQAQGKEVFFASPPVIPVELRPFIKAVRFPMPIIPLE